MNILVTRAVGANGNGRGALLSGDSAGRPLSRFSEDIRIADPRGLAVDDNSGLLFINSGGNRVLALFAGSPLTPPSLTGVHSPSSRTISSAGPTRRMLSNRWVDSTMPPNVTAALWASGPTTYKAQYGIGLLALLRGDYPNGFTQFEWRWRLLSLVPRPADRPAWQGEPLNGC